MDIIRDLTSSWSPMEGSSKAQQQSTFLQRALKFGRGVSQSMSSATADIKTDIKDAAGNLRENAAMAGNKLKGSMSDIQLGRSTVPKWAAFLGLGFWWAPGVAMTLFNCAMITAFTHAIGWGIHASSDVVAHHDSLGILNIVAITMYSLLVQPTWSLKQLIATGCVAIWGLRLFAFLIDRYNDEGVDRAKAKIRSRRGRIFMWASQAVWVFVTALPVMILNAECGRRTSIWGMDKAYKTLGLREYFGFALWIFGFAWEAIADYEKAQFRKKQLQEGDKPFIDSGLWKLSRHPNYFGEILMWTGLYIACHPSLHGWQHIAVLSPILTALLLRFVTGVPKVEAQSDRAFGGNQSYQAYKKRTPLIIPFM